MKKLMYYLVLMIIILIILPTTIIKSCKSTYINVDVCKKVRVYMHNDNRVEDMPLEDYIKGVVAAEMPADYDIEALKAQAIASRTYTLAKITGANKSKSALHDDADICTDSSHCQAWRSKDQAKAGWKESSSNGNWKKICRAVNSTNGIIMTCDGKIINSLYHANSGGKTENSEDVWEGMMVKYLRGIESYGEECAPQFKSEVVISKAEFISKIKSRYPDAKITPKNLCSSIKVTAHTPGGRVKEIRIADKVIKGTEIRTIFSLRSTNFEIEDCRPDKVKITVIGYGHGVGMSQCGANGLAARGWDYKQILRHYYRGIELRKVGCDRGRFFVTQSS